MSGQIWFTADLHLGHPLVSGLRGFATVQEHDQAVLDNWRRVVHPGDQVWVLGDIAVHRPSAALDLVAGLPGIKHLIAGNYDACHPMHRHAHKHQREFLAVFESVQAFARRRVGASELLLSHFPYAADHTETARYAQWRLRDEGAWLLHGHTHKTERLHGHEVHVGLDAWGLHLVSLDEVVELIRSCQTGKSYG